MSAVEEGKEEGVGSEVKADEKGGELLFCGATCWDVIGRKKGTEGNLVSPTRLRPLVGISICFVASGCSSCHCVALDVDGRCYTWGRNEKGQLGHGDTIQRDRPTVVSELNKYKIVKAGAGRNHTVLVTDDGQSLAFGWNKHGQLGSGSVRNEMEASPVRCHATEVKTTACGADFTAWLTSTEGASIWTAGLPQYGQLGHGTDNEYNTKESSVKLAYEAQPHPKAIASLSGNAIVKVACGTNHTVAVDSNGFVYTWGFGGHGRLGHREQKDEWAPRRVDVFQRNNVAPPNAVVSAGSASSACTAGGGQLYMWGKLKNSSDDWMYPKPLMDLSGWNLRCMDSGNMLHFVGADNSCISWGQALYGELGYGPHGPKSSAVPKKVDILEGMHVIGSRYTMVKLPQKEKNLQRLLLAKPLRRSLPLLKPTTRRGSQRKRHPHPKWKKRPVTLTLIPLRKQMDGMLTSDDVAGRLLGGVAAVVKAAFRRPMLRLQGERVRGVGRGNHHRERDSTHGIGFFAGSSFGSPLAGRVVLFFCHILALASVILFVLLLMPLTIAEIGDRRTDADCWEKHLVTLLCLMSSELALGGLAATSQSIMLCIP